MKQCKEKLYHQWYPRQCSRNASMPSGFCKQHDPETVKAKDDKKRKERGRMLDRRINRESFREKAMDFFYLLAAGEIDSPVEGAREICKKHKVDYKTGGLK